MTTRDIAEIINGRVVCCEEKISESVEYAFSSDLMSDVLKVDKENIPVLLTKADTFTTAGKLFELLKKE